jgi:hypothetical protein
MLDALAQHNVADSLAEMLRLNEARLRRLSKSASPASAADSSPPLRAPAVTAARRL